ncbi:MAG: YtxH domain-containing protein [Elusimicrobiota bacterium]
MSDRSEGNSLLFFLAGTAVGAALGVLLAPRAGEETRDLLADWMQDRKAKGSELLNRVKEESLVKKEALSAAARAAKDAYRETSSKHHDHDGVSA